MTSASNTLTRTPTAPERSLEQRRQALGKGNRIRCQRARMKRDLRELGKPESREAAAALMKSPPPYMATMKVWDLVVSARSIGNRKANRIMTRARVSPSKTLGGLTWRQREELAVLLLEAQPE